MKPKSPGVPRWSTPPQHDQPGVGQGVDQRVGRAGEVLVAEHDQHRARDAGQLLGVRGGSGRRRTAARAAGSLPGVWAKREKA